ncbi:unnamed protein product [Leuciscus chuanchicus]
MIISQSFSYQRTDEEELLQNREETMGESLKLITWNTCGIRDTADVQQKKEMIDLDREFPTGNTEPLRPYLEEFISSLMLVDVWGQNSPYERDSFTRFPWKTSKHQIKITSGQKKTKKKRGASRLDMVFMPRNDVWLAESCEISKVQRHYISDHQPVVLSLCLPEPDNSATVLSNDPTACSSGLKSTLTTKRPYKRRPGEICEAEVLKALMSLVEYETPLGENVQTLKINKEQKSPELKERFNQMIREGIPEGFTDSVKENGRYHFRGEYMILATILLRRVEKFLQPSFKSKTMKMSCKLFIIVSFRSIPKKIKRDFLTQALKSLKPIHPSPPRDFKIVGKLLPSTGQYKELREGCPLTPTLLTVVLKHLACALKKDLKESMVDSVVQTAGPGSFILLLVFGSVCCTVGQRRGGEQRLSELLLERTAVRTTVRGRRDCQKGNGGMEINSVTKMTEQRKEILEEIRQEEGDEEERKSSDCHRMDSTAA